MDQTGRKITKIAREVGKFTVQTMKEEGIGTAEIRFYPSRAPQSGNHPDGGTGDS